MNPLFLYIGLVFGLLAGLAAFLVTLKEWMHHYQGWREPVTIASRTGFFAFAFFLGLSVLLGFVVPFVIR